MSDLKRKEVIDSLNKKFFNWWQNFQFIPIFFKEKDVDLTQSEFVDKNHFILVYPNLASSYRTSLGKNYNSRDELIYNLRLYTNDTLGNIPHQSVISKLINFYKLESEGYSLQGEVRVVGPFKEEGSRSFIISNLSATYIYNYET